MSNPFENRIWKIGYKKASLGFGAHAYPFPVDLPNKLSTDIVQSTFRPLRSGSCVRFHFSESDVTIEMLDPASDYLKNVWRKAEDVYYEPEFYTIRGNVFHVSADGSVDPSRGLHFLFAYFGKAGPGEKNRGLHIDLLALEAETDATRTLLRTPLVGGSGSWKADED